MKAYNCVNFTNCLLPSKLARNCRLSYNVPTPCYLKKIKFPGDVAVVLNAFVKPSMVILRRDSDIKLGCFRLYGYLILSV